jgi:hypothetical protein
VIRLTGDAPEIDCRFDGIKGVLRAGVGGGGDSPRSALNGCLKWDGRALITCAYRNEVIEASDLVLLRIVA